MTTSPPNLSISPEKVAFVVTKAHQYEMEAAEPDLLADLTDDDSAPGTGGRGHSTDRSELVSFIKGLNVDEQIDLVALTWLGRGDGSLENWDELRAQAAQAHNNRTATYLIETPMLGDYLEEALSAFGLSLEDFEESL
ncbi:conserved hypothetical protein [Bradyrhizobium sp. ORS 278]|uniref:DUF3775 domain-containing protein n=1 Tax=Bradyrhizobium sp. (strain ORS 278) TaxID=114615 RepID=UPI0001508F73|nr:DUF3775 domain-containing protein [Bradyrhizobium sp. ORS 278]CAL78051.1 conserved hypothetical protein [Bradyrhizobium sp. ORS 278]